MTDLMFTRRDSLARFNPRQRRILIRSGIFVVILVYLQVFGIATWFVVVKGRNVAGKDEPAFKDQPALWKTPTGLKDLSISNALGRTVSHFGYEFEVPWDDLDEQRTIPGGSWEGIQFRSGKSIVFAKLAANLTAEQRKLHQGRLERLFEDESLQSDYAFTRAALEATPGDITLFTPSGRAARKIALLLLKSTLILANNSELDIYLIQTKELRGFQCGDPDSRPFEVVDDLYSGETRLHFVFLWKRDGAAILQPEINRVIQSVRAVQN